MRLSVIIPTYKRAWALPYVLDSLSKQSIKPDEVVIILKPSGDNSENVIKKFQKMLNIKIVLQSGGYSSTAYALAIEAARGDLLLFIDDDAIAHPDWVKNYIALFNELADAGAIGGFEYKAYMTNGVPNLTQEPLYHDDITKKTYYRAPL
ncbi:MAG: glycosyltransferase family A protein, partial [Thermoproteus sp.]|nr:glycosyltransferase family A protein [Thermoproteus sp.]